MVLERHKNAVKISQPPSSAGGPSFIFHQPLPYDIIPLAGGGGGQGPVSHSHASPTPSRRCDVRLTKATAVTETSQELSFHHRVVLVVKMILVLQTLV